MNKLLAMGGGGFVAGEDFSFGRGRSAGIKELNNFCAKNRIVSEIVKIVSDGGRKISSSDIRDFLASGDVPSANALLGRRYFICGDVVRGRGEGHKFGVPTANVIVPPVKLLPKQGVYKTTTETEGKIYRSLTNIGCKPTFNEASDTVETLIIGYSGNLYGKRICVSFDRRIRDVQKFNSAEELAAQIEKDKIEACCD